MLSQVPNGSSHSAVVAPRPNIANPTTQVGVEQHTTQDSVMDAVAMSVAPIPVAVPLERASSLDIPLQLDDCLSNR